MSDSIPALIPLYKHHAVLTYALVDAQHHAWLARGRWALSSQGYAVTTTPELFGGMTLMHRIVARAEKGRVVDHINHIRTDNRTANLRNCTQQENNKNRRSLKTKSGYRGVRRHSDAVRWSAYLSLPGRGFLSLGQYETAEDAAQAYDAAARKIHGEFAYLNFPEIRRFEDVDWVARAAHTKAGMQKRLAVWGKQGRMSNSTALDIREKHKAGWAIPDLAEDYGVSEMAITKIIHRVTYKKV